MMRWGIMRGLAIAIASSSSFRLRLSPRISGIKARSWSSDRSSFVPVLKTKYFPDRSSETVYCLVHLENPNELVEIPSHPFGHDYNDPTAGVVLGTAGGLLVGQSGTGAIALLKGGKYHIVPPNPAGDLNVSLAAFWAHNLVTFVVNPPEQGGFRARDLMVYDVINGTWRHVQPRELPDDRFFTNWNWNGCLYANDCFYLYDYDAKVILGFDLEREESFETMLPDFGHERPPCRESIVVFDGKLCFVSFWGDCEDERVEVWVTKVKRSSRWTRLWSISDPKTRVEISECCREYVPLIPMCYSACRNKVLFNVESTSLAWYNLETKEFEEFEFEESCANVIAEPCY